MTIHTDESVLPLYLLVNKDTDAIEYLVCATSSSDFTNLVYMRSNAFAPDYWKNAVEFMKNNGLVQYLDYSLKTGKRAVSPAREYDPDNQMRMHTVRFLDSSYIAIPRSAYELLKKVPDGNVVLLPRELIYIPQQAEAFYQSQITDIEMAYLMGNVNSLHLIQSYTGKQVTCTPECLGTNLLSLPFGIVSATISRLCDAHRLILPASIETLKLTSLIDMTVDVTGYAKMRSLVIGDTTTKSGMPVNVTINLGSASVQKLEIQAGVFGGVINIVGGIVDDLYIRMYSFYDNTPKLIINTNSKVRHSNHSQYISETLQVNMK